MRAATQLCCSILLMQIFLQVDAIETSSQMTHRVRTLPKITTNFSEQEWTGIVKEHAPNNDNLDGKTIEQSKGVGKLSKSVSISPMIVGGTDALLAQFPWQVYLKIDGSWFCGGSLILENWVLTAAHCAEDATTFTATFGTIKISTKSPGHVVQTTTEVYIHPKYDSYQITNDIALLKYADAVPLSYTIKPIALPTQGDASKTYVGTVATVSGFGLTSDSSSLSNTLKYMPDTVVTNADCVKWFGTIAITSGSICTKTKKKASCNGDSGGPLVYLDASKTWRQIGIVSFGSDAGCLVGPSVYTRVSSHMTWMSNTIGHDVTGQRDPSFTEPSTPPTKAPICSKEKFEKINTCCNAPRSKKVKNVGKNEKSSCGLSDKELEVFKVYSLNKYQMLSDNALKATDAKMSREMSKLACKVNCYLKEKDVISVDNVLSSEKLAAFVDNDVNVLGSSWNASYAAMAEGRPPNARTESVGTESTRKENDRNENGRIALQTMPELENTRIGISQNWKMSDLKIPEFHHIENIFNACNTKIANLPATPMFVNGKSNCNGQALLVVQCVLLKIYESCPEIMQDGKCLKEYDAFNACANAAQLF